MAIMVIINKSFAFICAMNMLLLILLLSSLIIIVATPI